METFKRLYENEYYDYLMHDCKALHEVLTIFRDYIKKEFNVNDYQ